VCVRGRLEKEMTGELLELERSQCHGMWHDAWPVETTHSFAGIPIPQGGTQTAKGSCVPPSAVASVKKAVGPRGWGDNEGMKNRHLWSSGEKGVGMGIPN
jgi:hypothetical protein